MTGHKPRRVEMEKVRIGVIGTGGMGTGHCDTMQDVEEVQLTAVCDVDEEAYKPLVEKYGVEGFEDYRELIESGLADAVIVATPHYDHPPISIYAMKKGLHVLSEKPIAVTVKAADEMARTAEETGVKFAVMYQRRSLPVYQAARRLVEEGRLGEIYRTCFVDPNFRTQTYYNSAGWRATWRGEGGGVMINQAPHGIDLFMWLGGLPSRVTAWTRTRLHDIEVEDEVHAILDYPNGARGYYYTSTIEHPGESYMELCGDRGKLVIRDGKLHFWELEVPVSEFARTSKEMWASPKATPVEVPLEERETGHKAIIRNFARSILYDEPLISPGVEGVWSVEFLNAVILSGAKGEPVDIPLDREEYERFLEEKRRTSREKKVERTLRITDPRHVGR